MQVILTHEQADFDAVAALLGAFLLDERRLPVAPRRANRNVRAFLTLYGADLPFIDPRDLSGDPIESILLVDTQSLITLKGLGPQTRIQVVDHHQPRADAPDDWEIQLDPLGAVTTLFVEKLQETGVEVAPIQASLLLLGIYEDTGSLTYSSTTPRDIRAAAFLLEQGASLAILGKFLNPPLSPEQTKIYDRLMAEGVQTHLIHGLKVIVACGSAEDMNEEVSSIAHKLRDLLEPDALFLFVTTGEGVRLVARSTTDRINVAEVAGAFGGGGHERAAAALLRKEDAGGQNKSDLLDQSCRKLLELLPGLVKPGIRVGQIMSRYPRLITPQTSANEAANLMQRYGYEGYPVVEDQKIVGLLTRRAVDRAISHKLNLPAASLMEAGNITVQTTDSIDHLQQVMVSSGWGQVPVTDPANQAIVGIVTRTDLLKTLSTPSTGPAHQNLASKLEEALPAERLALLKVIAEKGLEMHAPVYIVGGFVRDLLLDRASLDFDMVIEGDAIALAKAVARQFGGQVVSHTRFGTAKWTMGPIQKKRAASLDGAEGIAPSESPQKLDLISARTEFYEHPTALPTVENGSIKLDLHRRDFTINTLALRLDGRHYGELYDFWGGLNDLRKGVIRVLHSLSFVDDPTRLLRAVRFEQRFGFKIEVRTLELIGEALPMMKQVSGDRIRHELDLILAENHTDRILSRLAGLGILAAIDPDLPPTVDMSCLSEPPTGWGLEPSYAGIPTRRIVAYLVWLAPLKLDQACRIAARLRFSKNLQDDLEDLIRLRDKLPSLTEAAPSQVATCLDAASKVVLFAMYQNSTDAAQRRLVEDYVTKWKPMQPETTGDTLRALGVPPGPRYRIILNQLRDAWLDGKVSSQLEEQALLRKLLNGD